ncbi:MAG: NAD(+)/NADH kinase [Bacillota bacterium]|nr:NAD(+)/NADH kinase [Bacillota bacterium]
MKVLILYKNENKASKLAVDLSEQLYKKKIKVSTLESSKLEGRSAQDEDMVFVLGGDGTFLKAARFIAGTGTPILGINHGKIGFLNSIEPDDLPQALKKLLNHDYYLEKRLMIDITVIREGKNIYQGLALNDAIIRTQALHTININLSINSAQYANYCGDGVVCATPSGSTAYSYSAGGPVIAANVEALVITPICSQLSCSRALVVNSAAVLEFAMETDYNAVITVDGDEKVDLNRGDQIQIKKSSITTNIVQFTSLSCLNKITQKQEKLIYDKESMTRGRE